MPTLPVRPINSLFCAVNSLGVDFVLENSKWKNPESKKRTWPSTDLVVGWKRGWITPKVSNEYNGEIL